MEYVYIVERYKVHEDSDIFAVFSCMNSAYAYVKEMEQLDDDYIYTVDSWEVKQ